MPERIDQLQTIAETMRDVEARLKTIHQDITLLWQTLIITKPEKPV